MPFLDYLLRDTFPTNATEVRRLTRCMKAFVVVTEELYKRNPSSILQKFNVSNSIITDNGTQFIGKKIPALRDDYHIWVDWASVAHARTNGQVEQANGMVLPGLKPRIFDRLKKFAG
ncbi:uncharacterized protein [Setaria viridis]|uniref:uncharacterized protein n=1 Tax=Setaria viridis TaxID=4556 RepID=UPI003B3B75DF